jgi:hypothetical protein
MIVSLPAYMLDEVAAEQQMGLATEQGFAESDES